MLRLPPSTRPDSNKYDRLHTHGDADSSGSGSEDGSAETGSEARRERGQRTTTRTTTTDQLSWLVRSVSETISETVRRARNTRNQVVLPDIRRGYIWCERLGEVIKPVHRLRLDGTQEATRLHKVVNSTGFKAIVMAVIVACCCSTALEVDHSNWRFQGTVKIHLFTFLNNVFVVFFTAEIAMRIFDVGLREFFTNTKFSFWNIFDLTIVLIGIANQFSVDYLAYQFNSTGDEYHPYGKGNYWTASLGRVFRTARVLRVLHIFRHIPKLRVLSEGLIAAVMTVFWMMVLAFFMIFSFSIVMTMLMKEHINAFPAEEQPQIRELWGSVGATMFTAFQFLTMDGWSGIYRDIVTRLPYLRLLLCPFIFFGGFVIMSCLTGVMADYMNEVRKIQEIRETRQRAADVRHIVEHLKMNDTDHDGLLDLKEFIKLFEDEGFVKGLRDAGVKVDRKDAYDLFPWFDADHNEKVEFKEIIAGVETLCSGTDVVAMVKLGKAIRDAAEFVDANSSEMAEEWRPTNRFERHHQRLERTAKHLAKLENRTDELEAALRAFTNQFSFDLSLHTGEDPDSEQ